MTIYAQMLALSLFGGLLGLLGGILFLYYQKWTLALERNAIPYAAGVMITVALLGLLPEAVEHAGYLAYVIMTVAFVAAYCIEKVLLSIHHHGHESDHGHNHQQQAVPQPSVAFTLLGDAIHNFIDGVAIGATFLVHPSFGLMTAFSTFLHEIPHEIGDFGILLKAGWRKSMIVGVNALSALFTVAGTFSVLFFAASDGFIGSLMAISAGVFLYLGALDFLPQVVRNSKHDKRAFIPVLLGVATMLVAIYSTSHTH